MPPTNDDGMAVAAVTPPGFATTIGWWVTPASVVTALHTAGVTVDDIITLLMVGVNDVCVTAVDDRVVCGGTVVASFDDASAGGLMAAWTARRDSSPERKRKKRRRATPMTLKLDYGPVNSSWTTDL